MATEIAKSIGGQGTQANIDLATIAVKAAIEDWNAAKQWNFLLKDTSTNTLLTIGALTNGASSIPIPTAGSGDFINVGSTITISSVTGTTTLAAGTTVSTITRDATGSITSFTMSNPFGTATGSAGILSFTSNIPVIASTNEYNLPIDFSSPYMARTITNKRTLEYIKYREWNKKIVDQESTGPIDAYTIWNPVSPLTQNFSTYRLRVFRTPAATDTIHLQYFRRMDATATTVDVPDSYVYFLMDMAIWRFVSLKNTEDSRLGTLESKAMSSLKKAMEDDEENADDETFRLIGQMETWNGERGLWSNGNFYPTMLDY
jgi:hypothetical protein